jgi:hypothetical protein
VKLGFHVIDAHNHFAGRDLSFNDGPTERRDLERAFDLDLAGRIKGLIERGVDEAIILGGHNYVRWRGLEDTRMLNDDLACYRDRSEGALTAAVGIVEPTYGRYGVSEIERCRDELQFIGMSFHSRFQGVTINDPVIVQYLIEMQRLGMIPFLHAVGESPDEALWRIEDLAARFPEMTCVVLDAFSTFDQSDHVLYLAEKRPNLLFETGVAHGAEPILRLVSVAGSMKTPSG